MDSLSTKKGYVYVLSNPAFPELIKIGMTSQDEFSKRLKNLYTTGVPFPFKCLYAGRVEDSRKVETALHSAFDPERVNPKREFFKIAIPERVINLLKLFSEDVTSQAEELLNGSSEDKEKKSGDEYIRKRRPKVNFYELGLKKGSELNFEQNEDIIVKVLNERQVEYNQKAYYLTALTRELLNWQNDRQPTPYWLSEGKSLSDIYDEKYADEF